MLNPPGDKLPFLLSVKKAPLVGMAGRELWEKEKEKRRETERAKVL